jgi:hypothetical protein
MYNNLENLLEMIETKHEIDMLIENAIDNMSTRELEMLTEKGLAGGLIVKGKRLVGLLPNTKDIQAGRVAGQKWVAGQATGNIGRLAATARTNATKASAAERLASNIALAKKTGKTAGKVAGAGAIVGGAGVAGYGSGKSKGQKQGLNVGVQVGAELARREILAQIKAETDAKRKASLVNKAKNLFGMGE